MKFYAFFHTFIIFLEKAEPLAYHEVLIRRKDGLTKTVFFVRMLLNEQIHFCEVLYVAYRI